MTMPAPEQQPSPKLFFDTINAFQRTACLKAAIELELFTAIAEGKATPGALAARCQASERGVRILCEYLAAAGFLTADGNGFGLTLDSATFLDKRSPAYVGGSIDFLLAPTISEPFQHVAEAVRKGGTPLDNHGTMDPDHPVWVRFARGMAPLMVPLANYIAGLPGNESNPCRVLDIAAGHGLFGIEIAKRNPAAEVTAIDWPAVLDVAKENAARAEVFNRYHAMPGSAFELDFGHGYDVVLLTNFLHHFDTPTCESLLRKVHAALNPGGRAVTLEFVPNADRVSPPEPAMFSMTMLVGTPAGQAYTFEELSAMAHNAGFARSEFHPVPPTFHSVVVSEK